MTFRQLEVSWRLIPLPNFCLLEVLQGSILYAPFCRTPDRSYRVIRMSQSNQPPFPNQPRTPPPARQPNLPPVVQSNPFGELPLQPSPAYPQYGPPKPIGEDLGVRMLLPVGRSPWAIVAGYLGLISVLFVPAPLAIITGLLAIRHIRRTPNTHGMGRAIFGLVMGIVFTGAFVVGLIYIAATQ